MCSFIKPYTHALCCNDKMLGTPESKDTFRLLGFCTFCTKNHISNAVSSHLRDANQIFRDRISGAYIKIKTSSAKLRNLDKSFHVTKCNQFGVEDGHANGFSVMFKYIEPINKETLSPSTSTSESNAIALTASSSSSSSAHDRGTSSSSSAHGVTSSSSSAHDRGTSSSSSAHDRGTSSSSSASSSSLLSAQDSKSRTHYDGMTIKRPLSPGEFEISENIQMLQNPLGKFIRSSRAFYNSKRWSQAMEGNVCAYDPKSDMYIWKEDYGLYAKKGECEIPSCDLFPAEIQATLKINKTDKTVFAKVVGLDEGTSGATVVEILFYDGKELKKRRILTSNVTKLHLSATEIHAFYGLVSETETATTGNDEGSSAPLVSPRKKAKTRNDEGSSAISSSALSIAPGGDTAAATTSTPLVSSSTKKAKTGSDEGSSASLVSSPKKKAKTGNFIDLLPTDGSNEVIILADIDSAGLVLTKSKARPPNEDQPWISLNTNTHTRNIVILCTSFNGYTKDNSKVFDPWWHKMDDIVVYSIAKEATIKAHVTTKLNIVNFVTFWRNDELWSDKKRYLGIHRSKEQLHTEIFKDFAKFQHVFKAMFTTILHDYQTLDDSATAPFCYDYAPAEVDFAYPALFGRMLENDFQFLHVSESKQFLRYVRDNDSGRARLGLSAQQPDVKIAASRKESQKNVARLPPLDILERTFEKLKRQSKIEETIQAARKDIVGKMIEKIVCRNDIVCDPVEFITPRTTTIHPRSVVHSSMLLNDVSLTTRSSLQISFVCKFLNTEGSFDSINMMFYNSLGDPWTLSFVSITDKPRPSERSLTSDKLKHCIQYALTTLSGIYLEFQFT